jgi:radical SAM superfamily enzyme YgiQ (UPF0313 family)
LNRDTSTEDAVRRSPPSRLAQPRVLLVSNRCSPGYNIAPPTGLYQLHSYVSRRGIMCTVLDREIEGPLPYISRARAGEFDVIGFSVSHDNMIEDLDLLWSFRDAAAAGGKRVLFIAGGQEAVLNHEQWLRLGIDVCFLGFAEKTLLEFCRRLRAPNRADGCTVEILCEGLDGVAYRNGRNEVAYRPSAPLTHEDFRELFYEQALTLDVPYHRYWSKLRHESADTTLGASRFVIENVRLYTTSHCPRRCGFCNSQSFLPRSQAGKLPIIGLSAAEIAALILHMAHKYGARGFLFSDDDFPIGNKAGLDRLADLCRRITSLKAQGLLRRDTHFACQARVANFILSNGSRSRVPSANVALIQLMAAAGFGSVGLGVETFSDRLLRAPSVNKIGITAQDCETVLDAMLSAGLTPQINLILGVPEYTPDELADTMGKAVSYLVRGCDIAVTRHLDALPGAPLYGTDIYELRTKTWVHPHSGAEETIADFFLPRDPLIRSVSEHFDAESAGELAKVVAENGWGEKIVHKRVVGMCSLIAVAKLLGRHDLAADFRSVLGDLLGSRISCGVGS